MDRSVDTIFIMQETVLTRSEQGPKKVRKAEAMETATAEPLAFPETKMLRRVDGAPSVESEAETIADSAGLESGVIKSRAIQSDEARARKRTKHDQRRRARMASINSSQNVTAIDGAREAEGETDGAGKWEDSTELSHGLN